MSPQTYRTHSVGPARARASTVLRHEMTVVASGVADVVASAGGWLYDRRMAGWKVNVLVADRAGERALRILGADVLDLSGDLEAITDDPDRAATLAVAADVYAADDAFGGSCRRRTAAAPKWRCGATPGRSVEDVSAVVLPAECGGAGVQGASAAGRGYSRRFGGGRRKRCSAAV